jgi:hypothetical protein
MVLDLRPGQCRRSALRVLPRPAHCRSSLHHRDARVEKRITVSLEDRLHRFVQDAATEESQTLSATIQMLVAKAAQNSGRHQLKIGANTWTGRCGGAMDDDDPTFGRAISALV